MSFRDRLAVADRHVVDQLGEPISYTPQGGSLATVSGVFDSAYAGIDGGNHNSVTGSHPAVFFLLADLAQDPLTNTEGIALVIRGRSYSVVEVHKDHQGGVVLVLQGA